MTKHFSIQGSPKIALPIVAGIIGWTKQTRLTALVCVAVSIWCASNAYLDGDGARFADKQHGADQYAAAQADVARIEKEVADLDAQAARETKNGGCGKQCKYLGSLAEQRRHELAEAKQVLKNAKPVVTSGYEKLKAAITAGLFLLLIECLVWLSVPAMMLLRQEQSTEQKKTSPVVEKLIADAQTAKPKAGTKGYYLARLEKEFPALAAKVKDGELGVYKAAIEAGYRKARKPVTKKTKWTTVAAYVEPEKV